MQTIRISLRGTAFVLMGQNIMMHQAIGGNFEENQYLKKRLPHIRGNVGFVFTKGDLVEVRDKLIESNVRAPARAGADQNTGLGPEKNYFFLALSISTKISKGTIEIINDVPILKLGDKVGDSEATLLNMLDISPFSYGLQIQQVYDSTSIFHHLIFWTSNQRIYVLSSKQELPIWLPSLSRLDTQHWLPFNQASPTDSTTFWQLPPSPKPTSRKPRFNKDPSKFTAIRFWRHSFWYSSDVICNENFRLFLPQLQMPCPIKKIRANFSAKTNLNLVGTSSRAVAK